MSAVCFFCIHISYSFQVVNSSCWRAELAQTQLSETAQGEEAGMLKVFLCIADGYKLRGNTLGQPHAIFGAEKFKPLGAHLQSVNFQDDNIFCPPTLGVSRSWDAFFNKIMLLLWVKQSFHRVAGQIATLSRARAHSPTLRAVCSSVVKWTYCLVILWSPCSSIARKNPCAVPWNNTTGTSEASV